MHITDSHHHLWQYNAQEFDWIDDSMSTIRRSFGVDDLANIAEQSGVSGFVSVQARQCLDETQALLDMAETCNLIRGVVGWFNLKDPSVGETLNRFSANKRLKGARHVLQSEADPSYCLDPSFGRGIGELTRRSLVYDLLITPVQFEAAIKLVDQHPQQVFVLDHIAKPPIQPGPIDADWAQRIGELAMRPNVSCKFSGVLTEVRTPDWSIDLIRPYFETVLAAFGAQRLMFGSDWPVCLLRESYQTWLQTVQELAVDLSEHEQHAFFSENVEKIYGLHPSS